VISTTASRPKHPDNRANMICCEMDSVNWAACIIGRSSVQRQYVLAQLLDASRNAKPMLRAEGM